MNKKLILILALAFVVGISAAAFAEVQNVKVGGDITTVGAVRNQLDLTGNTGTNDAGNLDAFLSISRVKIDANLTDNVDVTFRLINERVWGTTETSGDNTTAVDLDLAYVTLKDFLKDTIAKPVTLTLGRQDLKIGSGLLIGSPNGNRTKTQSNLGAGLSDLSTRKAFDAIVGVIDLAPLTVTAGFLKVTEGLTTEGKDNNAYVVSGAYDLGKDYKNTVIEGTYVLSRIVNNNINNYGGRITSTPITDLNVEGEYVYQVNNANRNRASDAVRLAASYALPEVTWKPTVGLDFTRLSNQWNVMHEDISLADLANTLFANTNMRCVGASVSAKPMDDLTLKVRYANLALTKKDQSAGATMTTILGGTYALDQTKKVLGNEVDLGLAYDYTADVQFGLNYGLFKPGKAFDAANRKSASQVLGSMKVSF